MLFNAVKHKVKSVIVRVQLRARMACNAVLIADG